MKNKKGFTLVELLVVIVIIGLLIAIAVPSGLAISKKIKQKMLDTKIEQIESSAIVWAQGHKSELKTKSETLCPSVYNDDKVDKCISKSISELIAENALEEDEEREIDGTKQKVLINPTNNQPLNDCKVEIYQKNKRIYAKYDINGTNCYYTEENEESVDEQFEYYIKVNQNDPLTLSIPDLSFFAEGIANAEYQPFYPDNSGPWCSSNVSYNDLIKEMKTGDSSYAAIRCPYDFAYSYASGTEYTNTDCFYYNNIIELYDSEDNFITELNYNEIKVTSAFDLELMELNLTINSTLPDKITQPIELKYNIKDTNAPYLAAGDYCIYFNNNYEIPAEYPEWSITEWDVLDNFDEKKQIASNSSNSYLLIDSSGNSRITNLIKYGDEVVDCGNCSAKFHGNSSVLAKEADKASNYTCDYCNISSASWYSEGTCSYDGYSLSPQIDDYKCGTEYWCTFYALLTTYSGQQLYVDVQLVHDTASCAD